MAVNSRPAFVGLTNTAQESLPLCKVTDDCCFPDMLFILAGTSIPVGAEGVQRAGDYTNQGVAQLPPDGGSGTLLLQKAGITTANPIIEVSLLPFHPPLLDILQGFCASSMHGLLIGVS